MKSILLDSKPTNNNQLSVGSQLGRIDSSINNQHYQHLTNPTTTTSSSSSSMKTTENVTESIEKEHYSRLLSNSKKQVIRNRYGVKNSDNDKVKKFASDVSDGKSTPSDEQRREIKLNSSDNSSELEYLENHPLIVDNKISGESEVQSGGKAAIKLINLRKKNGTTLIFQRKNNAQKHQRANEYQELESFKKRRSLQQWPNTTLTSQVDTRNVNRHSWYESDHYPRAIEEEFDVSKQNNLMSAAEKKNLVSFFHETRNVSAISL